MLHTTLITTACTKMIPFNSWRMYLDQASDKERLHIEDSYNKILSNQGGASCV